MTLQPTKNGHLKRLPNLKVIPLWNIRHHSRWLSLTFGHKFIHHLSLAVILLVFTANCFAADSPLQLVFKKERDKSIFWKMTIQNSSNGAVVICLDEGSNLVSPLRLGPGEYYMMDSGPTILKPLFIADIEPSEGPTYRIGKRSHDSLLEIQFRKPPNGFNLQSGDILTLGHGRFRELPRSATVKVAIYRGSWRELSLTWTCETEQGAAANP